MNKGKLIVISGPSGVGKGTIVKKIIENNNNYLLSISATTRNMRPGETNGKEYHFLSKEEFEENIKNNNFAEYAQYAGNYYGTLCSSINNVRTTGKNLILEIEVNGALQIKEKFSDAILIFVLPPSFDELKKRLINRNTEDEETIKLRLSQVEREYKSADFFDYKIINDNLEDAVKEIINITSNF